MMKAFCFILHTDMFISLSSSVYAATHMQGATRVTFLISSAPPPRLVLVEPPWFIESKVSAANYQETPEHFMLTLAELSFDLNCQEEDEKHPTNRDEGLCQSSPGLSNSSHKQVAVIQGEDEDFSVL